MKKSQLDKPFIAGASVLRAGAHGKASGHSSYLHCQEVVRTLAGVFLPPVTDEAQVRAATIVHSAGIVYYRRKKREKRPKQSHFTIARQTQNRYCEAGNLKTRT